MMKMDDRDSAEYQFWSKRDITVILEKFLSHKKTKNCYSSSSPIRKGGKKCEMQNLVQQPFVF